MNVFLCLPCLCTLELSLYNSILNQNIISSMNQAQLTPATLILAVPNKVCNSLLRAKK